MRYFFSVVFMLIPLFSFSQTYEVGPTIGGANYIGDVGSTSYINPSTLGLGATFKWNRSNRHSFRFSFLYMTVEADDADSDEVRREQRGYKFENSIVETSLGIEYTFWDYNLHSGEPQFTPYLFSGLNYFVTNHFQVRDGQLEEGGDNWDFAIPMVLGIKGNITEKFIGALEIGARYTFTDNMDGSAPQEIDGGSRNNAFGNRNANDWYVFTGVTITFAFGRKPCFCAF